MKKVILFMFALALLFSSCNKDNGGAGYGGGGGSGSSYICKGTIQFINNSTNPYTVSVSGYGSFTLQGNHYVKKKYDKGSYIVNVKQNSGYLFYPTEESYTVRLGCEEEAVVSFPSPGPFKEE